MCVPQPPPNLCACSCTYPMPQETKFIKQRKTLMRNGVQLLITADDTLAKSMPVSLKPTGVDVTRELFPHFKFGAVKMPHSGSEDAKAAVTTGQGGGQVTRVPSNRQLRAVAARWLVTPSRATVLPVGCTAHEPVLCEQPGSGVPRFSSCSEASI